MIVLDPQDRVLLIEEAGTDPSGDWHHWLTPGGGVEADESLTVAATREVFEETGLRLVLPADAEPVHQQRRVWSWRGVTYDQLDHIFAARVGRAFEPRPAALTEMEMQTVCGSRWWSAQEIRDSDQTFITPDIADLVTGVALDDSILRPRYRPAGRALVLDATNHVLLINVRPDRRTGATNWITPGGGCEAGESPGSAAMRELFEETGIDADLSNTPAVSTERAVFPFAGQLYDQVDHFYPVRFDERPVVDDAGLNEAERAMTLEYRWWTATELRATAELFWPRDLAEVLDRLVVAP